MANQEQEFIPEIVGLTKLQLFLFVFFSISLGAAMFGLGFLLNNTTIEKAKQKYSDHQHILFENEKIAEYKTYICFGSFIDADQAKLLQEKIANATGQTCLLQQKKNNISLILGPFSSKDIAENEMMLIQAKTQINGSLIHEF